MSMYFRLDHGKPAAHHNIDNITLLMRLVGYKAKTSNPTEVCQMNSKYSILSHIVRSGGRE